MPKYKILVSGLMLIIAFGGIYPFLNGVGCNSVFSFDDSQLSVSGRCEKGGVKATFINNDTHDVYAMTGRLAIIGSQFFVFVNEIKFLEKSLSSDDEQKRYKYHRNVISGKLVNNHFILMYTPYPYMVEAKITGEMSFL